MPTPFTIFCQLQYQLWILDSLGLQIGKWANKAWKNFNGVTQK